MNSQETVLEAIDKPAADPVEARVDQALADTFPASDAPFWTLGIADADSGHGGVPPPRDA